MYVCCFLTDSHLNEARHRSRNDVFQSTAAITVAATIPAHLFNRSGWYMSNKNFFKMTQRARELVSSKYILWEIGKLRQFKAAAEIRNKDKNKRNRIQICYRKCLQVKRFLCFLVDTIHWNSVLCWVTHPTRLQASEEGAKDVTDAVTLPTKNHGFLAGRHTTTDDLSYYDMKLAKFSISCPRCPFLQSGRLFPVDHLNEFESQFSTFVGLGWWGVLRFFCVKPSMYSPYPPKPIKVSKLSVCTVHQYMLNWSASLWLCSNVVIWYRQPFLW